MGAGSLQGPGDPNQANPVILTLTLTSLSTTSANLLWNGSVVRAPTTCLPSLFLSSTALLLNPFLLLSLLSMSVSSPSPSLRVPPGSTVPPKPQKYPSSQSLSFTRILQSRLCKLLEHVGLDASVCPHVGSFSQVADLCLKCPDGDASLLAVLVCV